MATTFGTWTKNVSRSTGLPYYFDSITKQSIWHDDALPLGWAFGRESDGKTKFYLHMPTNYRTHEIPTPSTVVPTAPTLASSPAAVAHQDSASSMVADKDAAAAAQLSFIASKTAGDDLLSTAYIPDAATKGANIPEQIAGKRDYFFKGVPEELRWAIQVDEVSLYSITEWNIAAQQTQMIAAVAGASAIITDATACVGGNTISFAQTFRHVNSVELSAQRAAMLQHNVDLLKLHDKVSVYNDEYTNILRKLRQDVVFFDPPWGGKDYKSADKLDMFLGEHDVADIICLLLSANPRTGAPYSKHVALKAPVNYNVDALRAKIGVSRCGASIVQSEEMPRHRPKMLFLIITAAPKPPVMDAANPAAAIGIPKQHNIMDAVAASAGRGDHASDGAVAGTKRKEPDSGRDEGEVARRPAPPVSSITCNVAFQCFGAQYPREFSPKCLTLTPAGLGIVDAQTFQDVAIDDGGIVACGSSASTPILPPLMAMPAPVTRPFGIFLQHHATGQTACEVEGSVRLQVASPSDSNGPLLLRPIFNESLPNLMIIQTAVDGLADTRVACSERSRAVRQNFCLPSLRVLGVAGKGKRGAAYNIGCLWHGHKEEANGLILKIQPFDDRVEKELWLTDRLKSSSPSLLDAHAPLSLPLAIYRDNKEVHLVLQNCGSTLDSRIQKGGRSSPQFTATVLMRVLEAIQHVHNAGLIFCDLHPENVLLAEGDAVGNSATVIDMGSLQMLDSCGVYSGPTRGGRWDFMPVEQFGPGRWAAGDVRLGAACDVFSACAIAVFMLTGSAPFAPPGKLTADGAKGHPNRDLSQMDAYIRRHQDASPALDALILLLLKGLSPIASERSDLSSLRAGLTPLIAS